MSRNNTGNPLGSKAFLDFEDNVKNLDEAVNSEDSQWIDRFGRPRLPLMEQERQFVASQDSREDLFQSAQSSREAVFSDFLQASGYQFVGDYAPGIEITEYNQLIRSDGEFWRLSASENLPYTTTGAGMPEDGAFVAAGDAVLRQDLANPDKGAAMVARGVVAVDSIADLLALPEGQRREDLRYLVKGYHAGSDVGGGEFYWDTLSTEVSNGVTVFRPDGVLTGSWKRAGGHILTVDDAGIIADSPTTDQTARVQAFLNAASGRGVVLGRQMTVGINDTLHMPSNVYWLANGFNLFTLPTFAGEDGLRAMVKHESVSEVYVDALHINGNQDAFGGLYPVVGGDIPRGVVVCGGCANIRYSNFLGLDIVGNSFLHLSGGAWAQSRNIRVSGISRNCGIGFGQEIKQGTPVVSASGPGYTEYDNCWADLCNHGLYIAGGDANIIGGHYHSKRLQSLTIYTGDAHAVTSVNMVGQPVFEITPEAGTNDNALMHCINKQPAAPDYKLQQYLRVTGDQPKFVCNHAGVNLMIEEGVNVTLAAPVFVGGVSCVRTKKSEFAGPYRDGVIDMGAADVSGFISDGFRSNLKMRARNPVFRDPVGTSAICVLLTAGGDVELQSPTFGAAGSAVQPVSAVRTDAAGTRLVMRDAVDKGVTGTLYAVTLENAEHWLVENSTPGTSLVVKQHLGIATYDPPSLAPGASATTVVSVPGATVGDFAEASFSNPLQGVTVTAEVASGGSVSVRFMNQSGVAVNLAPGTLRVKTTRPV